MISSGFKFLFVVIFLAIYFCNASNNAPKNEHEQTCECGFVTDPPKTISLKDILTKTSNTYYAGTDDNVKLTVIKRRKGAKYKFCETNALVRPGINVLERGNTDNFNGVDVLGIFVHFFIKFCCDKTTMKFFLLQQ